MVKTISAYVNVALADYDESLKNHVVELMKESLREQAAENILEDSWEVVANQRSLYKNEDGVWVIQEKETPEGSLPSNTQDMREVLEVMTVGLTANVVGEGSEEGPAEGEVY